MTQFFGKPHGPLSASFASVSRCSLAPGFCVVFGVAVAPVLASFTAPEPAPFASPFPPFPAAVAAAAAASPFFSRPSSQSQLTRLTAFQKSVPCCFAMLSSFSLG